MVRIYYLPIIFVSLYLVLGVSGAAIYSFIMLSVYIFIPVAVGLNPFVELNGKNSKTR